MPETEVREPHHPPVYRFGAYTLRAQPLELERAGTRLKIQEQPLELLLRLVANAGQVVSRDDLYRELWTADSIVEFDAGLSAAVKKLRQALGDTAAIPCFVETVPKQGYRFIAPVELVAQPSATPAARPPHRNALLIAAACLAFTTFLTWFIVHRWNTEQPSEIRPLTVAPLTGRPGSEQHASFSPDGAEVGFSWDGARQSGTDLYVRTVGGSAVQRLTTQPGGNDYPVWSPDGLHIAFLHGELDLMLVSPQGGAPRKLAEADGYHVAWSPDSSSVLFGVRPSGEMADLWSVSIRSGEKHQLAAPTPQIYSSIPFAYSPGGRWFVFAKRPDAKSAMALYMVGAEGGEPRRLTAPTSSLRGWSWLSDREILFSARLGSRYELWRIPANGTVTAPLRFAGAGEDGTNPATAWRTATAGIPSRPLLAYQKQQTIVNLYSLTLPGGQPVHLLRSTRLDGSPQISPDGEKMVFVSDRSGFAELWLAASDGASPIALTHFASTERVPGSPKWSPDGRQLAFDVAEPDHHRIYVLGFEGAPPRRVVDWNCETIRPSWSRDGKSLYFGANATGQYEIWKAPGQQTGVRRKTAHRVTTGGGWEAVESMDAQRLYYMPTRAVHQLWQLPLSGGAPTALIPSGVEQGWWSVTAEGIYYADTTAYGEATPAAAIDYPIFFYRFATRRSETLAHITKRVTGTDPDFCVSPDGKRIVWAQVDLAGSNIMVVDGFR